MTITREQVDAALAALGIETGNDPNAVLDSMWLGLQDGNAYVQIHRNDADGRTTTEELTITD